MTLAQLVVVPIVIAAMAMCAIVFVAMYIHKPKRDAQKLDVVLAQDWQKSYRQLADAVILVIAEIEERPATYDTFPEDLRHRLFTAHEATRGLLERTQGRRTRRLSR